MKCYLITGCCGTGKTWVMKRLLEHFALSIQRKDGLYSWMSADSESTSRVIVLGVYDGTMFEGSDRLSMAVMTDNQRMLPGFSSNIVIAEGDRFTNSTFIKDFKPLIIRIHGDGSEGRAQRGSNQTERQIKSIATRVNNIPADVIVKNSAACLAFICCAIDRPGEEYNDPNMFIQQQSTNDWFK